MPILKKITQTPTISIDEIWQQVSQEISGSYIPASILDSQINQIEKHHKDWTIRMVLLPGRWRGGPLTVTPKIRVRAPYVKKDEFKFHITRKSIWHNIKKSFKAQKESEDHLGIYSNFNIKATDKNKVLQLVEPKSINTLLSYPKDYFSFKISDNLGRDFMPPNVNMLEYHTFGKIEKIYDAIVLKQIFEMFDEILDRMYELGIADYQSPRQFIW